MLIILLLIYLFLALLDAPDLIHKKYWGELAVYSGLMLAALVLSVLMVMDVPLPAVTTGISDLIKAFLWGS